MASTLTSSLFITIILSSLSLISSQQPQYTLPEHYFINCGSNSDITFTQKTFIGDEKPINFSRSGGRTAADDNPGSNTPPIYHTARVFSQNSSYKLQADETDTFVMVRLHFSPFFAHGIELSTSSFSVSVSRFSVLSDFVVGENLVIKEFIVPIRSEREFIIEFTPNNDSSPAFVNAIEAFTTPSELFRSGVSVPTVSPAGANGETENVSSDFAFRPVYRINVGGKRISVEDDTLRRNWEPDDAYIFRSDTAINKSSGSKPNFNVNGATATPFDAPYDVYETAKQSIDNSVNVTWNFKVGKKSKSRYLVRAHFCDFISTGLNDSKDAFNFFVYSSHKEQIKPGTIANKVQVPFYVDFVVNSDESDFVNVSIGGDRNYKQPAFLNGVEIMELVSDLGPAGRSDDGRPSDQNKGKKVYVVVGCVVGGVVLLLVLLAGILIGSKYGRAKKQVGGVKPESNAVPSYGRSSYTGIDINSSINHPSPLPNLNLSLRYPFSVILQATGGFDKKLMIGKGGFGKVYKGTLPDGTTVAVKRGQIGHGQGRPEFVTEILVLSKIRHRHLVTLMGYCDERSEMILVYEFMAKGTLQDHLYSENEDQPKLSWDQRLKICISATRGLHYLHTGADAGIIHRDVKSTNILLDENYVAKVADFGISRLDNVEESIISDIKGSFGYLDPEYIQCMILTQKSDVYSFGVVLLEVLCARPALDPTLPQNEANLAYWAIRQIKSGKVETIIDPYLVGKINPNSLRKFLDTVERCLKHTGDERPSMIDVLWDLEYALKLNEAGLAGEDSTMNSSLELRMSMIQRLPSKAMDDDSDQNDEDDSLSVNFPSESQVFSQLKMDEAR